MQAAFRAFNRWLDEDWGFAYEERIFGVPFARLFAALSLAIALRFTRDFLAAGEAVVARQDTRLGPRASAVAEAGL